MLPSPKPQPKANVHLDGIQQVLKDKSVCATYLSVVSQHQSLFDNKQVLILYSGFGFLALILAKTKVKHIHVICQTDQQLQITEILVKQNNIQDRVTTYLGPIESSYFDTKVDIIFSMPFGYCLYFDNRIETVCYARDNFLKKKGILLPDKLVMRCSMIQDSYYYDKKILFWEDVYNIDMSPMIKWVMTEPIIDLVDPSVVSTGIETLKTIDLYSVKDEELDFVAEYSLKVREQESCSLHGMVIWFDAYFSRDGKEIVLSTSPFSSRTKYKQSIFYLQKQLQVNKGDVITGKVAVKRSDNRTNFKIGYNLGEQKLAQYYFLT